MLSSCLEGLYDNFKWYDEEKMQTFNFLYFYFSFYIINNAFWKGWKLNIAFFWVNFWFRDFLGAMIFALIFSDHPRHLKCAAGLAQSVECLTAGREVAGSIPKVGPILWVLK